MSNYSSPVPVGCRLSSGFMTKARPDHAGQDYAPPTPGQTGVEVHAVSSGKVVAAGVGVLKGHSGNIIVIDHGLRSGNGSTDKVLTNYGHLARMLVKKGDTVKAGQVIAIMGNTGNSSNVHLHFGVRFNGRFADPHRWMRTKGVTPGSTRPVKIVATDNIVLREGSKGKAVGDYQREMNRVFPSYANFKVDDKFGDYTGDVTAEFQRRAGITVDRVVGSETRAALKKYGVKL